MYHITCNTVEVGLLQRLETGAPDSWLQARHLRARAKTLFDAHIAHCRCSSHSNA